MAYDPAVPVDSLSIPGIPAAIRNKGIDLKALIDGVTYTSIGAAPAAKGVTNGDSHDHNGGDGGQIAYSTLSGVPMNPIVAALIFGG